MNSGPASERFLRNASIVDQNAINRYSVVIIGVGAIGSHLAEMLAKLGVLRFVLIDPDEVDEVNLSAQGFYEDEVGKLKVAAVADRLEAIHHNLGVATYPKCFEPGDVPSRSCVFSCVDSMRVRRQVFRDFLEKDWPVLFDGRMAAESLRVFCVERDPEGIQSYKASLFPTHEAYRESCTARSTIYAASMAAAVLCSMYKRWAMIQAPERHIQFDLFGMDCFR